ncbi:MAG: GNAT family N-acetyltransferase [Clostridiales bacterium]|nr:GNAT family N-acetyltransferase [Clostridiales bacterium]
MVTYRLKDGSECIIRKATVKDAAEIVKYSNTVGGESDFLSYGRNEFGHNIDQEKQMIKEYNESLNRIILLALVHGEISGVLTFWGNCRKRLEHWGEMGISVLRKYWNIGVGTTLINYFFEWAECNHIIKKVDLMVREDNYHAIMLYKKMGFQIEGRIRMAMKKDGNYYDFFYMGKIID